LVVTPRLLASPSISHLPPQNTSHITHITQGMYEMRRFSKALYPSVRDEVSTCEKSVRSECEKSVRCASADGPFHALVPRPLALCVVGATFCELGLVEDGDGPNGTTATWLLSTHRQSVCPGGRECVKPHSRGDGLEAV
jgi:hypothetical protein